MIAITFEEGCPQLFWFLCSVAKLDHCRQVTRFSHPNLTIWVFHL
jgi:hypothetical protein